MGGASYYLLKLVISAALIVAVSEIAKRNSLFAALTASLPIVSVLAFIWLYAETRDVEKIANLATGIFWLVIPSLALFIALPLVLKSGISFWPSFGIWIAITITAYFGMLLALKSFSIQI